MFRKARRAELVFQRAAIREEPVHTETSLGVGPYEFLRAVPVGKMEATVVAWNFAQSFTPMSWTRFLVRHCILWRFREIAPVF